MRCTTTRFGERMTRHTGALELMDDLGSALARVDAADLHLLGGGNPARIAAVEAVYRRRLHEIADDASQFGRFAGSYAAPGGDLGFRAAVAETLARQYGWPLTARNVGLASGSQSAFFFLFNLFAGERADGTRSRILLPLAPEYIGYVDLGLCHDMLVSQPALVEDLDDGFFKYRIDFERLRVPADVGAICVSRPTNPSGNVLAEDELERLDALARAHGVPLIIDAAYGLPFPGIQHAHPGTLWNPNVVLCLSLSKLGLPALRTGIVVADEPIIEALTAFNATAALAPGSAGPALVEPLLRSGELAALCEDVIRPHYRQLCGLAVAGLQQACEGLPLRIHRPEGAFFLWLRFPGLPIPSAELYRRLKRRGVYVLSGHHFFPGLPDDTPHRHECLRLSYAQPVERVRAGIAILAEEVRKAYGIDV
ncbi:MAG TPA: valine--pyruvate transaminase [Steroidobacteraceae bacterium]|nr:valine--pyruvate transaminase [Steroidobacteraceae bacterium]